MVLDLIGENMELEEKIETLEKEEIKNFRETIGELKLLVETCNGAVAGDEGDVRETIGDLRLQDEIEADEDLYRNACNNPYRQACYGMQNERPNTEDEDNHLATEMEWYRRGRCKQKNESVKSEDEDLQPRSCG